MSIGYIPPALIYSTLCTIKTQESSDSCCGQEVPFHLVTFYSFYLLVCGSIQAYTYSLVFIQAERRWGSYCLLKCTVKAIFLIYKEFVHNVSFFYPFLSLASTTVVSAEFSLDVILNSKTFGSSTPFHPWKSLWALWIASMSEVNHWFHPLLRSWHLFQHGRWHSQDSQRHHWTPQSPHEQTQNQIIYRNPFGDHWSRHHHHTSRMIPLDSRIQGNVQQSLRARVRYWILYV